MRFRPSMPYQPRQLRDARLNRARAEPRSKWLSSGARSVSPPADFVGGGRSNGLPREGHLGEPRIGAAFLVPTPNPAWLLLACRYPLEAGSTKLGSLFLTLPSRVLT